MNRQKNTMLGIAQEPSRPRPHLNMRAALLAFGAASAMALTPGIVGAAETTFAGYTDGCFGAACVPPATPITATQSITFNGLTYANSTFNQATAGGFLSLGGSPGTPNVDNLGLFSLSATPFSYTGTSFNIGITFTAPGFVVPVTKVISGTILGSVLSANSGGVFIDFDNTIQHYTFGQGPSTQQFDFWINDLSITSGRVAAVTGSIVTFTAVPEPDTYALMFVGLGLMGFIARRRKQYMA